MQNTDVVDMRKMIKIPQERKNAILQNVIKSKMTTTIMEQKKENYVTME